MPWFSRFARAGSRACAFSLTELLVVVGIVAILMAMLAPVFFNVRENGRQTACLSNMRQLATALQMYADDSDGYFPTLNLEAASTTNVTKWDVQISPYMKNNGIFRCPDLQIPNAFVADSTLLRNC